MIIDDFTAANGLRQGDTLALNLFNTAFDTVTRQLLVQVKSMIFYKSVQPTECAQDMNIME